MKLFQQHVETIFPAKKNLSLFCDLLRIETLCHKENTYAKVPARLFKPDLRH